MPNRRDFLKHSVLLGAVAGLGPVAEVLGKEKKSKAAPAPASVDTYTVDMKFVRARPLAPHYVGADQRSFGWRARIRVTQRLAQANLSCRRRQ